MYGIDNRHEPTLGDAIGNSLEIEESIDLLKGNGPADLEKLIVTIGGYMAVMGDKAKTTAEGQKMCEAVIHNGKALASFEAMVRDQGVIPMLSTIQKGSCHRLNTKFNYLPKLPAWLLKLWPMKLVWPACYLVAAVKKLTTNWTTRLALCSTRRLATRSNRVSRC